MRNIDVPDLPTWTLFAYREHSLVSKRTSMTLECQQTCQLLVNVTC